MSPVYTMAAITLAVSVALWGGLIYFLTGRQTRYFWLLLLGLSLSAIANFLLKPQAIIAVGRAAHVQPGLGLAAPVWFLAFQVLVSPLVEEPLKVLPLLLGPARKMLDSRTSALWVGFALGVSFGLGEAAVVAYGVARSGAYDYLPWYAFTGFFNERVMTCFAHGVMTSVLVIGMQRGGRFSLYGFLGALGLHLFLNAPTVMYQVQWISATVYSFSLLIPFIGLAVVFETLRRTARNSMIDQDGQEVVYWRRQYACGRGASGEVGKPSSGS